MVERDEVAQAPHPAGGEAQVTARELAVRCDDEGVGTADLADIAALLHAGADLADLVESCAGQPGAWPQVLAMLAKYRETEAER